MQKLLINGVDVCKIFPGLHLRYSDGDKVVFTKPGEEKSEALAVIGENTENGGSEWKIVATLRGKECELYDLLAWQDKSHVHLSQGIPRAFGFFILFLLLFFLMSTYLSSVFSETNYHSGLWLPLMVLCVIVLSFIISSIGVALFMWLLHQLKCMIARSKINIWLARHMSEVVEREYFLDILRALTDAKDRGVVFESKRTWRKWNKR